MKNNNLLISIGPMGNLWECGLHTHTLIRQAWNWGCAERSPLVILAHTISQLKGGWQVDRSSSQSGRTPNTRSCWALIRLFCARLCLSRDSAINSTYGSNSDGKESRAHMIHTLRSIGDRVIFLKGFNQTSLPGKVSKGKAKTLGYLE